MYINCSVLSLLTSIVCKDDLKEIVVYMTFHKNQVLCKLVAENNEKCRSHRIDTNVHLYLSNDNGVYLKLFKT